MSNDIAQLAKEMRELIDYGCRDDEIAEYIGNWQAARASSAGAVPEGTVTYLTDHLNELAKQEEGDRDHELEAHLDGALRALTAAPTAPAVEGGGVPIYVCHSCGNETPPPAPFSMPVKCPCGHTTAATIAAGLAKHSHTHNGEQGGEWYCSACGMKREPDQCDGQEQDRCHYVQRPAPTEREDGQ